MRLYINPVRRDLQEALSSLFKNVDEETQSSLPDKANIVLVQWTLMFLML